MSKAIELAKECGASCFRPDDIGDSIDFEVTQLEAFYAAAVHRGKELMEEELSKQELVTKVTVLDEVGRMIPMTLTTPLYAKPIPWENKHE